MVEGDGGDGAQLVGEGDGGGELYHEPRQPSEQRAEPGGASGQLLPAHSELGGHIECHRPLPEEDCFTWGRGH